MSAVIVQMYMLYIIHCGNSDRHLRDSGSRGRAAGKSGSRPADRWSNSGGPRLGPLGSLNALSAMFKRKAIGIKKAFQLLDAYAEIPIVWLRLG